MSKIEEIRKKPGMSNAGKYDGLITAGPHGTYPLNKTKGGPINPDRVQAALALGHHLGEEGSKTLRRRIGTLIKGAGKKPSLANKLLRGK